MNLGPLTETKVIGLTNIYSGLAWGPVPPLQFILPEQNYILRLHATISGQGFACAVARSGFTIRASDVPNRKQGLVMYSTSGAQDVPFQGGTLCINLPIHRSSAVNSGGNPIPVNDCSGSWSIDFHTVLFSLNPMDGANPPPPPIAPGTTIFAQWWGRDPGYPARFNSILSDALQFALAP